MSDLQVFSSPDFGEIRTIEENGAILFCGRDVAKALGYANTQDALSRHCRGVVKRDLIDALGRKQEASFIPEGDIYRLAAKSELPGADAFESWIFDEVLPSIRRNGAYMTPETLEAAILSPDYLLKVVTALKDETDKRKALEAANASLVVDNAIMKPKADYFDELVARNLLTNIRETAKQLNVKERDFVAFLLGHKYLYRDKRGRLMPFAEKNNGLFQIKETINDKTGWSGTQTLITPKGRETFRMLCI